jgi:hypothetical protein
MFVIAIASVSVEEALERTTTVIEIEIESVIESVRSANASENANPDGAAICYFAPNISSVHHLIHFKCRIFAQSTQIPKSPIFA